VVFDDECSFMFIKEAALDAPERDIIVSFNFGPGDDTMAERFAKLF
jgi:hypothetical protein